MSLVLFLLCVFYNIYSVEFETGSLKKFSRLFRRNLTILINAERILLKFRRPIQKLLLIKILTTKTKGRRELKKVFKSYLTTTDSCFREQTPCHHYRPS